MVWNAADRRPVAKFPTALCRAGWFIWLFISTAKPFVCTANQEKMMGGKIYGW
jgi:hypothetical protein